MEPANFRVGLGHDAHRLEAGRPLRIGGIAIESERGAVGHSDADVLLHALTDALLGAAALGDIGAWFPDDDPTWKNADSADLLTRTLQEIRKRGWRVANVDATIFLERPKLAPHRDRIRARVTELLGIDVEAANVKAKTGERVGPIGREEAIAADAVVLLLKETGEPNAGARHASQ